MEHVGHSGITIAIVFYIMLVLHQVHVVTSDGVW